MANSVFHKVTTTAKTFKVEAVETSLGFFGGRKVWRLCAAPIGVSNTHIADFDDIDRIGEAKKLAIPNVQKIEVIY